MTGSPDNSDKAPQPPTNSPAITRNERVALLVFFVITLLYAGWQYYQNNLIRVELGEDIPYGTGGILVQVEGAVESPGLIYLPAGARVSDAVEAAGGLASDADRSRINLAELLEDGQRVIIPSVDGSDSSNPGGESSQGVQINRIPISPGNFNANEPGEPGSQKVNINTANTFELQTLPGIGEEFARRIIEYRLAHTVFERIEDIMLVEGIAEGRFEDIRDLITVTDR